METEEINKVIHMKALVLAAGQVSRLEELTKHKPKALLRIAGISLLGRVLHGLREVGVQDVWVVVGYKADVIRKEHARWCSCDRYEAEGYIQTKKETLGEG